MYANGNGHDERFQAARVIESQKRWLSETAVELLYRRDMKNLGTVNRPNFQERVCAIESHLSHLAATLEIHAPDLFMDYAAWATRFLVGQNTRTHLLPDVLAVLADVIDERLPTAIAHHAGKVLRAAIQKAEETEVTIPSFLHKDAYLAALAEEYHEYLLHGYRCRAAFLIRDALQVGISVPDIYDFVIKPCLYEAGRLWQLNQITVGQGNFYTAASEMVLSQLYLQYDGPRRERQRLVGAAVGAERHDIGLRMLVDTFEGAGWQGYYLGAGLPVESIVKAVVDQRADLVAISTTITAHLPEVVRLIEQIRRFAPEAKILAGGRPFLISPNLWQKVGADGSAPTPQAALQLVSGMVYTRL